MRTILFGLLLSLFSCCALAQSTGGAGLQGATGVSTAPPAVPPQAAAVGYNTLTYSVTNFTTKNVDTQLTRNPGYKVYMNNWNSSPVAAALTLNADGSITSSYNNSGSTINSISSIASITGSTCAIASPCPTNFHGVAFGGGFYIEVTAKWPPATDTSCCEVAFYLIAAEARMGGDQWGGQTAGYPNYDELDTLEWARWWCGSNQYCASVLNWYNNPTVSIDSPSHITVADSAVSSYHKYGTLVTCSGVNSAGSIKHYFDGTLESTVNFTAYNPTVNTPPPVPGNGWAYNPACAQHYFYITGGTVLSPMTIQSINAWQVDASNDMIN